MASKKTPAKKPTKKLTTPAKTSKAKATKKPAVKSKKSSGAVRPQPDNFKKYLYSVAFARGYAVVSLLVLLSTSVYWALLGARLQQFNADQLINVYLFEKPATFSAAHLPAAHTFLLKWPLFLLVKAFGTTNNAFIAVTIGVVVATVLGLAAILYRIERRPLIFGSLCLALASVLIMIPAQPYAGGLLPANFAMLTTRNIEYIIYIISLGLLVKAGSLKNHRYWLSIILMSILIASDKLFMTLGIGGALIAIVAYLVFRRKERLTLPLLWLLASIIAAIAGTAIIAGINASHVTHIANQAGASPYALTHTPKNLVLGIFYAVFGVATNLGANPAVGTTTIKAIPHQTWHSLTSFGGVTFVVNACLLLAGLAMAFQVMRSTFVRLKKKAAQLPDNPTKLSVLLLWSSAAALAAFVATRHDYAVDGRYLAIILFALFISAATYLRKKHLEPQHVVLGGLVMLLAITLGLTTTIKVYRDDQAAIASLNTRNVQLTQVLKQHPVTGLVGDYWRVTPAKQAANNDLSIVPLSNCLQDRDTLSSNQWQFDLRTHSFAYLLSLDPGLTDYPSCTLNQIIGAYGRPNASTLIDGTLSKPKELLLFYDNGANHSAPAVTLKTPSTVLPIPLGELPNTTCSGGQTIVNVVAHQDDDLLFMNPDLNNSIKAGNCVRSVYMTAGDDGFGVFYWLSRERGAEAAYSQMLGTDVIWVTRIVKLSDGQFITVANPRGNPKISLVFMHLPDGNLVGQGFHNSSYESLEKLNDGRINTIHSVDGQSEYTADQLAGGLVALLNLYQPNEIRTQATINMSRRFPDHSDHLAVGRFVERAYPHYNNAATTPISYYIGYPIRDLAPNLDPQDTASKATAFFAYSQFDPSVCHNDEECSHVGTYNAYLRRQYKAPNPN